MIRSKRPPSVPEGELEFVACGKKSDGEVAVRLER
jgi:hypothetical protein